jgi:MoxR-like ATPase
VRLVAVDGPAGSGKSTRAAQLARALGGAPVIDLDDFFAWTDLDGWWPRFEAEVVTPLLAGRPAVWGVRDWAGDPHGSGTAGTRTAPPWPAVVLDGVSSSRAALAGRLALRVWVEAPREERLRRGLARDGEALRPEWEAWQAMEDAHFARDRTRDRADVVHRTG